METLITCWNTPMTLACLRWVQPMLTWSFWSERTIVSGPRLMSLRRTWPLLAMGSTRRSARMALQASDSGTRKLSFAIQRGVRTICLARNRSFRMISTALVTILRRLFVLCGFSVEESEDMNKKTMKDLLEKWEYRMFIASTEGGAFLPEHEAEELWYLLKELEGRVA